MMLDDKDGHAAFVARIEYEPSHKFFLLLIHAGHGLVKDQKAWLRRKRSSQLNTFFEADRNSIDELVSHAFELKEVNYFLNGGTVFCLIPLRQPPVQRGPRDAWLHVNVAAKENVVEHAHTIEERKVLKCAGNAQPCNAVWREPRNIATVEQDTSALRRIKSSNRVREGRLPTPVRADQSENFTAFNLHIDAVEGDDAAEPSFDRPTLQYRT